MYDAVELAVGAAEAYRMYKAQSWADWEEPVANPALEVWFESNEMTTFVLESSAALPHVMRHLLRQDRKIDACVISLDVVASDPYEMQISLDMVDPAANVSDAALLTIAITRAGEVAVKMFHYFIEDDGGIQFEEREVIEETFEEVRQAFSFPWKERVDGNGSN